MAKYIRYSEEFREKAVAMFSQNDLTAAQVAENLGVHRHTLCRWIRLYRKQTALSIETVTDHALFQGKCHSQHEKEE